MAYFLCKYGLHNKLTSHIDNWLQNTVVCCLQAQCNTSSPALHTNDISNQWLLCFIAGSKANQLWPTIAQQRHIMLSFRVLCEKCFWHTAAPQPGNELLCMSICSEHLRQMGDTLRSLWPLRFPKEQQAYLKWEITPMLISPLLPLLFFILYRLLAQQGRDLTWHTSVSDKTTEYTS